MNRIFAPSEEHRVLQATARSLVDKEVAPHPPRCRGRRAPPSYLNEFVFRGRGLIFYRVLELAVAHDPVPTLRRIWNGRPITT